MLIIKTAGNTNNVQNQKKVCLMHSITLTNTAFQIFPSQNHSSGNALPIQLNERTPKTEFGQTTRVKRQISNQDQTIIQEEETLSPLMVRNFPPLVEEKQNCM